VKLSPCAIIVAAINSYRFVAFPSVRPRCSWTATTHARPSDSSDTPVCDLLPPSNVRTEATRARRRIALLYANLAQAENILCQDWKVTPIFLLPLRPAFPRPRGHKLKDPVLLTSIAGLVSQVS